MPNTFLLLGSNIGNRVANIRQALLLLVGENSELLQVSHFYETKAWGNESQPDFYNLCARFSTKLTPEKLLVYCKKVEQQVGRQIRGKWEEREIDIDILYYGDEVINQDDLKVPHARLIQRKFALEPLAEIAPQKKHPILDLNSVQLLQLCTDAQSVIRLNHKSEL